MILLIIIGILKASPALKCGSVKASRALKCGILRRHRLLNIALFQAGLGRRAGDALDLAGCISPGIDTSLIPQYLEGPCRCGSNVPTDISC